MAVTTSKEHLCNDCGAFLRGIRCGCKPMTNHSSPSRCVPESLHDRAMSLPSIHDLRDFVKLPADNITHIANLEKAYADARSIIVGLIDAYPVSEIATQTKCDGCGEPMVQSWRCYECHGPDSV